MRSALWPAGVAAAAMATLFLFSPVADAQTFQSVPALSFVKSFGGADPLPQAPTIAAAAGTTGFNFSVTSATTNSGGSWLSVSTLTGCGLCAAPRTISVIVTANVALAVGTYTGQVVLTSQNGMAVLTIPVSLTIVTAGSTVTDNLPGQMSFSLITSSTTPTSQTFQVRNPGSGTLNWTATKSTADGGSWLTISSTSGTAPSSITVGIVPGNLPGGGLVAGTFVGQIVIQASSGNVTVPVSLVLGTNIFSQVNSISFVKVFGGLDPLPQTLTIASTGTTFNYTVTAYTGNGGSWLSVSTVNGCGLCPTPHSLQAIVSPSVTLAAGTYTAEIVVTSQSGSQSIVVPVTMTIATAGSVYLDNLPGQTSFSMKTAGTIVTGQDIQVRNGGSGSLNWNATASTADGGNWLSLSAPSGTAPSYITISISVPNLPSGGLIAGTYIGQVLVQTTGNSVTIPVSVVVGDNIFVQVNAINFTKVYAGNDPLPQTLAIASTGTNFNFTVAAFTATGGSWLTVSTINSCGLCPTPHTISASVATSPTLAVGTYTGQIVVTAQSGFMSLTIPVTLTVAPAATTFFDNVPGQLVYSMKTGGSAISSQEFQIRNAGTGTLDWTLAQSTSDGGNWLTVSSTSGTAPAVISVGISVASLPSGGLIAGTFVGEVVLRTDGSSVTIPVTVVVGDSVFRQVNPISFTKLYGGANPLPQTVTMASTGTDFNFTVTSSTANGGSWLSVSTVTSCGLCPTPHSIVASIIASPTLAAGTYTGQIVLTAQSGFMSVTIPVTLTVAAAGTTYFDNIQGQMGFFFQAGGGNPATQNIRIRNAGSGILSWTLATSTSDTGNWLTVSAASGTAPATVTVGVTANALPGLGLIAGVFVGEIVLKSANGNVTIPVSVVVGPNVFVQLSALSFTKAYGGANPVSQVLNVASSGTAFNFTIAAATGNGGSWLTATGAGSCGLCATPKAVTAAITANPSLAVGTYTGQIVVTSQSGAFSMTIPVTLTVGVPPGPTPTDASPSAGSGLTQTFAFTFDAPNGYQSLSVVDVLINNFLNGIGACYIAFVPSGPSSGSVFLVDDAGDAGGPYSGLTLPGSGTVQNSQCSISGDGSSVTGSGDTLTLTLAITFKAPFAGNKVIYMAAQDTTPINSGWHAEGTWNVTEGAPSGPYVVGASPAHANTSSETLTITFGDTNGFADVGVVNVLINDFINGIGACYIAFVPSGPTSGSLYLVDDAGDAGGPFAGGFALPGGGTASNGQCTLNAATSSVSGSGNTLTLTLDVSFNHSFAGDRVIYAAARSDVQNSDWQAVGTVSVP